MAPNLRWQDPVGRQTLNTIVKKLIPRWKDSLRPVQEDLVAPILDREDILCCTATGDGKSAAFSVPILVLNEYNKHRDLYPAGLPTCLDPVGMVVTPTKGLASNIYLVVCAISDGPQSAQVAELTKLDISALAYCRESLAKARRAGINLADEIKTCSKWQVICVDPEHLRSKEWRIISEFPTFRARLVYSVTDEVHLINEWGVAFRPDFKVIGLFQRGRLPSTISIVGLSATLAPGAATTAVYASLGFYANNFHLIRRTNERPNIQFIMQELSHGLAGYEFPDLLPFLRSGRKLIVHFSSFDVLVRCYVYIWHIQSPSADKLRRTRMYHSLCPAEYNQHTLKLIDEDPHCQIILATIAFSNGIKARSLLDSISMGFSATVDIAWQEKGRVGRDENTQARGVILVQPSTVATASKQINGTQSGAPKPRKGSKKRKPPTPMDETKARFLLEKTCYIAFLNKHYGNPPLKTSTLDCIAAKRPLPCSLCAAHAEKTITFSTPPNSIAFPFANPTPTTTPLNSSSKKHKLTKKERENAASTLLKYRNKLCADQHFLGNYIEHPQSLFLPTSVQIVLLDQLLSIDSRSKFDLAVKSWRHRHLHSSSLHSLITEIRTTILEAREVVRLARNAAQRSKRKSKRRLETDESEADEYSEPESLSDDSLSAALLTPPPTAARKPRKRLALEVVTNVPRAARARAPVQSAADVAKEYGPGYNTSWRRAREPEPDVGTTGLMLRRSSRYKS